MSQAFLAEHLALVHENSITRKRGYSVEEDEQVLQNVGGAVLFVPSKKTELMLNCTPIMA